MRRSREKMFPMIEEWEKSNESREAFCQRHNLPLSTFSYWRTKHAQAKEITSKPGFVKLQPQLHDNLEVVYPNGVKIRLPEGTSLSDLRALIQLM